ncbi:MAG: hypothetical protein Tsb009_23570 [Planctomycetaceae bacterium]
MSFRLLFWSAMCLAGLSGTVTNRTFADPPSTAYIFPAGGQRGTTVPVRIGGFNLHESASFYLEGKGIVAPGNIQRTKTIFFEGPVIPQPASQRGENYPKDYAATFKIDSHAKTGARLWRVGTSQGVTTGRVFVVGDLPEVVEQEIDGRPVPTNVKLPVTINGRIFPREDVDIWTFSAKKNQTVTCEVVAARIGSPLDSRLEIRDESGLRIAENVDGIGVDSRLTFTVPKTGTYAVHIHDVNFGGLQHYVYRLTITAGSFVESHFPLGGRRGSKLDVEWTGRNLPAKTSQIQLPKHQKATFQYRLHSRQGRSNLVHFDLSDLTEHRERDMRGKSVSAPAVLNGRILKPGEVDSWQLNAKKGNTWLLDLKASRLGSKLDSVLTVLNADGKTVATSDDMGKGQTDSQLRLKIPVNGIYTIQISDRFVSRGGPQFGYRLYLTKQDKPAAGFRLSLPSDAITVTRGQTTKVKVNVERLGGFKDEIQLKVNDLPKGVTVSGTTIGKNKRNAQLTFTATKTASIAISKIQITGYAEIDGQKIQSTATAPYVAGLEPRKIVWLAVAIATPFKFKGIFETKYGARGATFSRSYQLDRGGFTGPITVQLADLQIRHLQGVSGPKIVIPPTATEFTYTISLPPWMEIGRTSRTCLMLVGTITDEHGKKHRVSYSSQAQNDQIIVLVDPARLSVSCQQKSVRAIPNSSSTLAITVSRGNELSGPVDVDIIIPEHFTGVSSKRITIPENETKAFVPLKFGETKSSVFNMPLTVRATLRDRILKKPFIAETPVILVKPR